MQTKSKFDEPAYQLHSHSDATARAAAFGQLVCFFALVQSKKGKR